MDTTVKFVGMSPLAAGAGAVPYQLWSYTIDFGGASPVAVGELIALAFPSELDVQDPAKFPGVPELVGMFMRRETSSSRQYVGRAVTTAGNQVLTLVAPAAKASCEVLLVTSQPGQPWAASVFSIGTSAEPALVQMLPAPAAVAGTQDGPITNGKPVADFAGTLPYASEVFGVYQPLAGWLGRRTTQRMARLDNSFNFSGPLDNMFSGDQVRMTRTPLLMAAVAQLGDQSQAVLSPVGLVTLFREYFFEFDNFLGVPSGHLWISPGGTVEVVESSTRRTLIEKTAAQSEDSTSKVEESLTNQDDIADAVKEDNANDTKLGASASAGAKFAGIYQADASASFSNQTTTRKSSEVTHKHARNQSTKVSSEIHRNFKTTFKTVTETTDVTSRRYVVQNTSNQLVNYELRRKMRKVGVQVQHIGTRLSWQVFLDTPGTDLGLGELVHVVPAPDLTSIKKPDLLPRQEQKLVPYTGAFPITKFPGTKVPPNINQDFILHSHDSPEILDAGMEMHIVADISLNSASPTPGYMLRLVSLVSARSQGGDITFVPQQPIEITDKDKGIFHVFADRLNSGNLAPIELTFNLTWDPPAVDPAKAQHDADVAEYNAKVSEVLRTTYVEAVRDRMKLVSEMRRRPSEDLRKEERQTVYGKLIRELQLVADKHISSELIRQIFDVDEMLYFAAPDYWQPRPATVPPRTGNSIGRYPVPHAPAFPAVIPMDPLEGETVVSWYSHTDKNNTLDPIGNAQPEWRIDYLITEDTRPAPFGSSLGWLIQIDGDERRNEFLNAAWVKAVLPIRVGHELEALDWLAQAKVEGEAGMSQTYPFQPGDPPNYQGKTLGDVLQLLAADLQAANTDIKNTLATEKVFETGFDPLGTGFRPAEPYMIFDEWLEVLPTDQVVAVEVQYDPKTGKML